MDKQLADMAGRSYQFGMAEKARKFIKTKFRGVYYRVSGTRQNKGRPDQCFVVWYTDAAGKAHWETIGWASQGITAAYANQCRQEILSRASQRATPADKRRVTVGQVVEHYARWAIAENRHVKQPLDQYDHHLRAHLHKVPLSDLTPAMLSDLKILLGETLSPQSVKHHFSFLRRAIYRAMTDGLWHGTNPCSSRKGGTFEMPRVDNKRVRFFTPEEATALLAELGRRSTQLRDMSLLSLRTGLRATEIFSLTGSSLAPAAGLIHFTGKGGVSQHVACPAEVMEMLLACDAAPDEYIFRARGGGPIRQISDAFQRAVTAIGLNESGESRYRITFHTWRHTFASWLAQSGRLTLQEIQHLLRHESITMTERYAHLIPNSTHSRLSIIADVMAAVPSLGTDEGGHD